MAFVPDEAIEDAASISPTAFRMYCLLCKRRNHSKKTAYASVERLQAFLGIQRSNAYSTLRQLNQSGWVASNGGEHELLKGNFEPVDRRYDESKILDRQSKEMDEKSENFGQHIRNTSISFQPNEIPAGFKSIDLENRQRKVIVQRHFHACAKKFPNVRNEIIELGILYTLLRRSDHAEPIASSRYFWPEIERMNVECRDLGERAIEALVHRRRQQYFETNESHPAASATPATT